MTLSEYLRDCAQVGFKLFNAKIKVNNRCSNLDCAEFFRYKDYEVSDVYKSTTNNDNCYVIRLISDAKEDEDNYDC